MNLFAAVRGCVFTPALVWMHLCLSLSVYTWSDAFPFIDATCVSTGYMHPFSPSNKHIYSKQDSSTRTLLLQNNEKMSKCPDRLGFVLDVQEEGCFSARDLADIRPGCVRLYWTSRSTSSCSYETSDSSISTRSSSSHRARWFSFSQRSSWPHTPALCLILFPTSK